MSNVVVISGRISDYGVKIRPLPSGKWELNFTLCCDEPGRDGQTFTLYVPVLVYGPQCEPLAESLEPHDVVLVTGKLGWTKRTTKDGEKSGLAVTTFGMEVLVKAEVLDTGRPETHEPSPEYDVKRGDAALSHEPASVPATKHATKPRIPKASGLEWQPEQVN